MYSYTNTTPLSFEQLEEIEKTIYWNSIIDCYETPCEIIDIANIMLRTTIEFHDKDYNMPQNIFLIKNYNKKIIVGRKIRSVLRIEQKINAINCSMITAPMFLGILQERSKNGSDIVIKYFPFNNNEKLYVFNKIKSDSYFDIYYPYKFRDFYTKKEEVSPKNGWDFNLEKKEYLGYGEQYIRNFIKNYFKDYNFELKKIYDPACSTGQFLNEFKQSHPTSITIGGDLSKEMVEYAKNYVDETFCCNAIDSPILDRSIDLMFLRFLNSEVVSTVMAHKIMKKLITKVKQNGKIVCFGHTPVLIRKEWFEKNGLKIIISSGYNSNRDAIFQCYIMNML